MSSLATPQGQPAGALPAPTPRPAGHASHTAPWLWVMCLAGVDYFSTLGYQPSIAFDAAGRLAPLATLALVGVTLGCAVPVYRAVATKSPHGQGSISMLERMLHGWWGKLLVLVLLGFAATDFVITKTLSAADAAEHLRHNPFWEMLPAAFQGQVSLTMGLLVLLGAMFMRGFKEVIGVAVVLAAVYMALNAVVILAGVTRLALHPTIVADWWSAVRAGDWLVAEPPLRSTGTLAMIGTCLLLFPKMALGLSGFETGVAMMPLVAGDPTDDRKSPAGRIRNTRRLLLTAALIMSVYLIGSSVVTTMLIDPHELLADGAAVDRALAYIAHGEGAVPIAPFFGPAFGAVYDASTVLILWFAGASAMSGLLNLVPRYLPRYGMAPRWAAAFRPLVLFFTAVNLLVTWVFDASVTAQGGAYATGVMMLMLSAAVAVTLDKAHEGGTPWRLGVFGYALVAAVFLYTTVAIVIEKPDGMQIALAFIGVVLLASIVSRVLRSTEMRFDRFEFASESDRMLWDTLKHLEFPVLVPHRPGVNPIANKESRIRRVHRLSDETPVVFIEATLGDTSNFTQRPMLDIVHDQGRFILRVSNCVSVPHAIATIALELSKSGKPPEVHCDWSEKSPLAASFSFILFGEGNVPWIVHELLCALEPDPKKRPRVIVG